MNSVALNLATWSDGTVTANRRLVKVIRDSASETGTYVLLLTLTPAEALIRFCLEIERIPTVRTRIAPETEWKRIFSLYMVLSFRAAAEGRWHSLHLFFNRAEIAPHAQPKADHSVPLGRWTGILSLPICSFILGIPVWVRSGLLSKISLLKAIFAVCSKASKSPSACVIDHFANNPRAKHKLTLCWLFGVIIQTSEAEAFFLLV